jgi:predicted O-methyltransferase YrrM
MSIPATVADARRRAEAEGFIFSSEPEVGRLLASLAAAVPPGGRILELGTGVGSGLAWLVHGLGDRIDVEIVTVDIDDTLQGNTRATAWPDYVHFELGDGAALVPGLGTFDLIFADAPGGKTVGLDRTIGALAAGGILMVDDMDIARHDDAERRPALARVRELLHADARLICAELDFSSGVILAVRRHDKPGSKPSS